MGGDVYLNSINALPKGTVFNNVGNVNLSSLIGGWIDDWKGNVGNVKGIHYKRLLNKMISLGLFDRKDIR
jgi:hypothetical protein